MRLNEDELDALEEVINIGVGRAANALSEVTGSRIELRPPNVQVCDREKIESLFATDELENHFTIQQRFRGDISGQALLSFLSGNAIELARIVGEIPAVDDDDNDMDDELCGVLEEIGNIVLNSILGSVSNLFDCGFSYTLPALCEDQSVFRNIIKASKAPQSEESLVIITDTSFKVADNNISGSLTVVFETGQIRELLAALNATEAA